LTALQADYVTVVEDRPILSCLQNILFHFWPKLTHPAARSLCDSWATCLFCLQTKCGYWKWKMLQKTGLVDW